MSPKIMPPAISAIPPHTSSRRAPMGANAAATLAGVAGVAISYSTAAKLRLARVARKPVSTRFLLVRSYSIAQGCWAECRHHVFGEHVLRLDALPMFQPAKVGDNRQFADSALLLERAHLADHFLRRADKADLLLHDLLVGQLCERLEGSTGIETIPLGSQLHLLLLVL